jgi:hypothetical protein
MSMQPVADAWNRVVETHSELPKLALCQLQVARADYEHPRQAWDALKAMPLREGWLLFQSHVACFADGQIPAAQADWGCLLAAEAITNEAQARSILVRQDGNGGLFLVTLTPGTGTGAEDYLADEVSQLATGKVAHALGLKDATKDSAKLRYRRYWRPDEASGFRPALAAFIGFSRPA